MHARSIWAFLLAAYWPFATAAGLDTIDLEPGEVVQVEAFANLLRDDNLFRLPDVDPRLFGISPSRTSDTIRVLGLGLKLDKPVSRQRFLADLRVTDSDYDNNPQLNHTGYNALLGWEWRVGNYWSGELEVRRREYLAGFAETQFRGKDIITAENYVLSGGYQFHPRWRVVGSLGWREYSHSADSQRSNDFEGKTASIGLNYRTPADNSVGLEIRRTNGDYPNRDLPGLPIFDNGYTETEIVAPVVWRVTGALLARGEIGYTRRKHENFSERDFSGVTGRASAIWDVTAKVRLTVTGYRDIRSLQDQISNYVLVNYISVTPAWAITSKVVLQGAFIHETRDFSGDPGIVSGIEERKDTLRTARLGIVYSPLRYLDFSLSYQRGDRNSNRDLNDFDYELWFGAVTLRF